MAPQKIVKFLPQKKKLRNGSPKKLHLQRIEVLRIRISSWTTTTNIFHIRIAKEILGFQSTYTYTQQCHPPWGFSSFESATSGSSWWSFKLCRSEPSSAVSEAWQQGLRLEKATMQSNVAKKRRIQAFLEEDAISQKPMEERSESSWVSEKRSV